MNAVLSLFERDVRLQSWPYNLARRGCSGKDPRLRRGSNLAPLDQQASALRTKLPGLLFFNRKRGSIAHSL